MSSAPAIVYAHARGGTPCLQSAAADCRMVIESKLQFNPHVTKLSPGINCEFSQEPAHGIDTRENADYLQYIESSEFFPIIIRLEAAEPAVYGISAHSRVAHVCCACSLPRAANLLPGPRVTCLLIDTTVRRSYAAPLPQLAVHVRRPPQDRLGKLHRQDTQTEAAGEHRGSLYVHVGRCALTHVCTGERNCS